mgnify:CR=1 FL=1
MVHVENVSVGCWYRALWNWLGTYWYSWECEWCPCFFIKNKGYLRVYACIDNYTSEIMADPFCVFLALYSMAWTGVTHSMKLHHTTWVVMDEWVEHVIRNCLTKDDIVVYTRMGTSSAFVLLNTNQGTKHQ